MKTFTETAFCNTPLCEWKHEGETWDSPKAAQTHAIQTGHQTIHRRTKENVYSGALAPQSQTAP